MVAAVVGAAAAVVVVAAVVGAAAAVVVDAAVVGAAAAVVVTPQNSSTDLPLSSAAWSRFRHGGACGFFGLPFANPFTYALHRPECAGPLGSGPTPRAASDGDAA